MMRAALAVVVAACSPSPPSLASCADSIGGVWQDPAGRRWSILDHGERLEIYPAFADTEPPPGTLPTDELAPRMIALSRAGDALTGVVRRRSMRAGIACDAVVTARVIACRGATLELAVPEPPAPTAYEPMCAFPDVALPAPARWTWVAPLR
jgi:hypothetical protein